MSDEWSEKLFDSSWGGFPLAVLSIDDDLTREIVEHEFVGVDGAETEDTGAVPRRSNWSVLFAGKGHLEDFAAFVFLHDGIAKTLVHPLFGSFEAKLGPLNVTASGQQRNLIVTLAFVESTTEVAVAEVAESQQDLAGQEAARLAGQELDLELQTFNLSIELVAGTLGFAQPIETSAAADADTLIESWINPEIGDATVTASRVSLEAGEFSQFLEDEAERLGLSSDPTLYPIWLLLQRLNASVATVADAVLQRTPRLTTFDVLDPTPLLAITAGLYGARDAEANMLQILDLNRDIRNPALVAAGSTLTIETP